MKYCCLDSHIERTYNENLTINVKIIKEKNRMKKSDVLLLLSYFRDVVILEMITRPDTKLRKRIYDFFLPRKFIRRLRARVLRGNYIPRLLLTSFLLFSAEIEEDFKDSLNELVPLLLARQNLIPKKVNDLEVTATHFIKYLKLYVSKFNDDETPTPKSIIDVSL